MRRYRIVSINLPDDSDRTFRNVLALPCRWSLTSADNREHLLKLVLHVGNILLNGRWNSIDLQVDRLSQTIDIAHTITNNFAKVINLGF